MKQINPLYLLLFLLLLLVVLFTSLQKVKAELNDAKSAIVKTTEIANEIVSLKRSWGDKKRSKKALLKILNSSLVKRSGLTYKVSSSKVVIDAESLASKELSYLLNKVLNKSLTISSLRVRSLDKYHVSLHMEVQL